ncbi:monovalent cation/H+ antiporter subunit A [Pontibaca methylaminivorans]|uniref:Multisubunit potassium/proton antiporter, PhaA subunit /multisubunit potassium/proton antiporter, PhaB subunit n=1 Tax=Pontibaca methylaminivorans TaxID=515897 RepID=A0A1R3WT64_9RHOB|nr:monovalent cation/H+ antiporter subunit A [Pontibaca methylaminivorans]SIT81150.1 multisubunit potassium/proton antiporter, PhaA subunit /multisubunit potassium/proton antiporter, PhaB subunit [Pontibaca methylaminivorans]
MNYESLLITLVILPFLMAVAVVTLHARAHNAGAWLAGMTMVLMLAILSVLAPELSNGPIIRSIDWVDTIGLNLRFRIDAFAALFIGLVAGIGLLVVTFAHCYLSSEDPAPRFYASLLGFTGAMSGIVLSGNIIMLVVFWELTTYMSFLLISYWSQKAEARDGARHSLIVTASGGLCLLAAMILLGEITGSYEIESVLEAGEQIREHALYLPVLILFLLGAFTKSAQFPFHFWLPGAMAAPTPVSAYLHSATMVKAGVFLMLRFAPALAGTDWWLWLVAGTGIITMTMGAVIAMFRSELKELLAYSTISHLGLITALAGIGTPFAITVAVFHIINHAMFKAALFMIAGIIDHETGARDLRRLSGLVRLMPITALLTALTAAAMAGLPFLNGFLSKEMFLDAAHQLGANGWPGQIFIALAVIGAAAGVTYSLKLAIGAFLGPPPDDLPVEKPHDPRPLMWLPVAVLAAGCLTIGLFPGATERLLFSVGSAIIGPLAPQLHIRLWHGLTPALMMSLAAYGGGALLYVLLRRRPQEPRVMVRIDAVAMFERLLQVATRTLPQMLTAAFGTTHVQVQLRILVLLAALIGILVLPGTRWWPRTPEIGLSEVLFALLWLVGGACAIGAAWQAKYHRFAALILMSGAGMVTCVSFVWLSAPDLAVTQLLVEIVTTVLLLLGLRWLPQRNERIPGDRDMRARIRRGSDLLIAILGGMGMTAMAYAVMAMPSGLTVGDWFLRNSYDEGGGTNVVNVILVDFRAFDTFGEITVLSIVALTVFVLLRRFRPAPASAGVPNSQRIMDSGGSTDFMYVTAIIMNWVFAATVLASAYLFFRGHDLPGGGFAAGVTLAIGLLLQYLARDVRWVEARIIVLPVRWMAAGLTLAMLVGVGAWLFGYPFLTQHAQYVDLPVIGRAPAATALLFDLGVFATVVGATVLMLIAIAHQSLRVRKGSGVALADVDPEEPGPEPAGAGGPREEAV